MSRQRPTFSIDGQRWAIQVTDDGSRTLVDPHSGVAYHSASGAMAETVQVYLRNSGVERRLREAAATSVLEIGLGTGMSLLVTLRAAQRSGTKLTYTAIENEWVDASLLQRLEMDGTIGDPPLVRNFIRWRETIPDPVPAGLHVWNLSSQYQMRVIRSDARSWADAQATQQGANSESFDAIYFDPFAPDVNPELWRPDFLGRLFVMLNPGGRLVTYCVNRKVRDTMTSIGFDVQRVRGPLGGKREVMTAVKAGS